MEIKSLREIFGSSEKTDNNLKKEILKDLKEVWINSKEKNLSKVKDPIKSIRGIMKKLRGKYNSVELQHDNSVWLK